MTTTQDLVEAVKAHATDHYNDGGWDVIVECWTDEELAAQIGRARTIKGALAKFAPLIDVWADRQAAAAQHDEPFEPESQPWRPCCSRANIDCCGHDDYDYGPKWTGIEITSPGYCNHSTKGWVYCHNDGSCRHPECLNPPF